MASDVKLSNFKRQKVLWARTVSPVIVRILQLVIARCRHSDTNFCTLSSTSPTTIQDRLFFVVLFKIEDDEKASCTIPPRNLLRTPVTYKGNGTTYESTLSARSHKQRRCCFDTCSNFSSHSNVDLRFYAGSTGRCTRPHMASHFVRVNCRRRGVMP